MSPQIFLRPQVFFLKQVFKISLFLLEKHESRFALHVFSFAENIKTEELDSFLDWNKLI